MTAREIGNPAGFWPRSFLVRIQGGQLDSGEAIGRLPSPLLIWVSRVRVPPSCLHGVAQWAEHRTGSSRTAFLTHAVAARQSIGW